MSNVLSFLNSHTHCCCSLFIFNVSMCWLVNPEREWNVYFGGVSLVYINDPRQQTKIAHISRLVLTNSRKKKTTNIIVCFQLNKNQWRGDFGALAPHFHNQMKLILIIVLCNNNDSDKHPLGFSLFIWFLLKKYTKTKLI